MEVNGAGSGVWDSVSDPCFVTRIDALRHVPALLADEVGIVESFRVVEMPTGSARWEY